MLDRLLELLAGLFRELYARHVPREFVSRDRGFGRVSFHLNHPVPSSGRVWSWAHDNVVSLQYWLWVVQRPYYRLRARLFPRRHVWIFYR